MNITPAVATLPEGLDPIAPHAAVPCRPAAGPAVLRAQELALWLAWYRSRWAQAAPGGEPPKVAHAASSDGAMPQCTCATPSPGAGAVRWRCGRCGLRPGAAGPRDDVAPHR